MSKLSDDQITARLEDTPGWEIEGNQLVREFKFGDFDDAMDFVEHVAERASEQDHHPDILIQFDRVTLTLSTHSAGGITDKDIELAKSFDLEAFE